MPAGRKGPTQEKSREESCRRCAGHGDWLAAQRAARMAAVGAAHRILCALGVKRVTAAQAYDWRRLVLQSPGELDPSEALRGRHRLCREVFQTDAAGVSAAKKDSVRACSPQVAQRFGLGNERPTKRLRRATVVILWRPGTSLYGRLRGWSSGLPLHKDGSALLQLIVGSNIMVDPRQQVGECKVCRKGRVPSKLGAEADKEVRDDQGLRGRAQN